MIDEMLLEHVTPPLDDIQESLFERFSIDTKPRVKHSSPAKPIHFYVQLLVGVNLGTKKQKSSSSQVKRGTWGSGLCPTISDSILVDFGLGLPLMFAIPRKMKPYLVNVRKSIVRRQESKREP